MSHNVLQQISRFTNRTVRLGKKDGKNKLVSAGSVLMTHAKKEGYKDQWNFHEQHQRPRTWRQHYRFMEHKRMYSEGMNDRLDFVLSGYTAKTGFSFERGIEDNPRFLHYKQTGSTTPVDKPEWRAKYKHLLTRKSKKTVSSS